MIVYQGDEPQQSVVGVMDPVAALALTGRDEIRPVAEDVKARMQRVLDSVRG